MLPASPACTRSRARVLLLSPLPSGAGLESKAFMKTEDGLANEMGLFLQKTNIIRDYLVR